jgi:hypothetical protein
MHQLKQAPRIPSVAPMFIRYNPCNLLAVINPCTLYLQRCVPVSNSPVYGTTTAVSGGVCTLYLYCCPDCTVVTLLHSKAMQ